MHGGTQEQSFEIAEGEILGIIGKEWRSKTSTHAPHSGVEQPPTSGKIYTCCSVYGCNYMDVGSSAGKNCPSLRWHTLCLTLDLWSEGEEALNAG